jgi:NAD+ synthase (glutamine-hydrolysing)
MSTMRLALAQVNLTVGDLAGNETKIIAAIGRAREMGAHLVALPELAVTGYPPEDLLLKPGFVAANLASLERIARAAAGTTAIVGFCHREDDLYNAAAVLHGGRVAAVYHKAYLPTYAVFDEDRYFRGGEEPLVVSAGGGALQFGVNICEDIWVPAGPTEAQALAGAQLVVNISASPYHAGKGAARERMLATRAADNIVYVAFCNLVGGQDELVFDGGSVIFDPQGEVLARGRQFAEDLVLADLDLAAVFRQRLHDPRLRRERACRPVSAGRRADLPGPWVQGEGVAVSGTVEARLAPVAEAYEALVLGTGDYARKNGFRQVVLQISGGVDSSLAAAIAVAALGPENVTGVFMPSPYTSEMSREDAMALAENLGIAILSLPIDGALDATLEALAGPLAGHEPDVTEENLQARIRGNIVMALSNKFGWLVLTTGNKSEMSVGYSTLYGDMAGGFAVIKDVPKMLVYALARHVNAAAGRQVIPQRVLERAPTAELRPDQTDQDSLPPYEVLDPILEAYVEEDRSLDEIVALGFEPATVAEVLRMVDRAEYKRRQAPPGVRITERALGKDRRLPITNHYREPWMP